MKEMVIPLIYKMLKYYRHLEVKNNLQSLAGMKRSDKSEEVRKTCSEKVMRQIYMEICYGGLAL